MHWELFYFLIAVLSLRAYLLHLRFWRNLLIKIKWPIYYTILYQCLKTLLIVEQFLTYPCLFLLNQVLFQLNPYHQRISWGWLCYHISLKLKWAICTYMFKFMPMNHLPHINKVFISLGNTTPLEEGEKPVSILANPFRPFNHGRSTDYTGKANATLLKYA